MATTSRPPRPPAGPRSGQRVKGARGEARGPITLARLLAAAAIAAVVAILLFLIFLTGGGGTEYKLMFKSANGLVLGNQVDVGGAPVGTVKQIVLTKDFKAMVTVEVNKRLTPLHEGTRAQIRVPSLSSASNRYIALDLGPNNMPALKPGATIPIKDTKVAVDLDQVFNIFTPKTRHGLRQLIEGFASQYEGAGKANNISTRYFSPALLATNHVFHELTTEEKLFSSFLVEAARATTTLSSHGKQLGSLVRNAGTAFDALGSNQASLEEGIRQLPRAFQEGGQAFAGMPAWVDQLRKLVEVSKPNTRELAPFFDRLSTLLGEATPVVKRLDAAIDKPGANNDLTDFALSIPGLAKSLKTASPSGVKALHESVPITAFFGPYSPDLQGLFRDFGQSAGYYDGNGHYMRASPNFADFKLNGSKLVPVTPQEGLEGLESGQLRRCPGAATQPAADGSSPFTDEGKLSCDPTEVP